MLLKWKICLFFNNWHLKLLCRQIKWLFRMKFWFLIKLWKAWRFICQILIFWNLKIHKRSIFSRFSSLFRSLFLNWSNLILFIRTISIWWRFFKITYAVLLLRIIYNVANLTRIIYKMAFRDFLLNTFSIFSLILTYFYLIRMMLLLLIKNNYFIIIKTKKNISFLLCKLIIFLFLH